MDFYLPPQTIHVWHFNQLSTEIPETDFVSLLNPREQARLDRLKHPQQRQRHMQAQAKLRILLSKYLNTSAQEIEFNHHEYGKPYVANQALQFNLTHSKDRGMLAVGLDITLGLDLECWHSLRNRELLINRHFAKSEQSAWSAVPNNERESTFFRLWTCKEAFMKATGRGLGLGLSRCAFDWRDSLKLIACPQEYGDPENWAVTPIAVHGGASATLVTDDHSATVVNRLWSDELMP